MIREVLRMGDPRLLQRSAEVERFGTPELAALLQDMRDTMAHLNGAGKRHGRRTKRREFPLRNGR